MEVEVTWKKVRCKPISSRGGVGRCGFAPNGTLKKCFWEFRRPTFAPIWTIHTLVAHKGNQPGQNQFTTRADINKRQQATPTVATGHPAVICLVAFLTAHILCHMVALLCLLIRIPVLKIYRSFSLLLLVIEVFLLKNVLNVPHLFFPIPSNTPH